MAPDPRARDLFGHDVPAGDTLNIGSVELLEDECPAFIPGRAPTAIAALASTKVQRRVAQVVQTSLREL